MDKESITKAYESAYFLKRDIQSLMMTGDERTRQKIESLLKQLRPIEQQLEKMHIETIR